MAENLDKLKSDSKLFQKLLEQLEPLFPFLLSYLEKYDFATVAVFAILKTLSNYVKTQKIGSSIAITNGGSADQDDSIDLDDDLASAPVSITIDAGNSELCALLCIRILGIAGSLKESIVNHLITFIDLTDRPPIVFEICRALLSIGGWPLYVKAAERLQELLLTPDLSLDNSMLYLAINDSNSLHNFSFHGKDRVLFFERQRRFRRQNGH